MRQLKIVRELKLFIADELKHREPYCNSTSEYERNYNSGVCDALIQVRNILEREASNEN